MALRSRSFFSPWKFAVYGRHKGQLYQHRNDRAIYFFFHGCLCWWLYTCISLRILGILAFCKPCVKSQRTQKNKRCYFLGITSIFYGGGIWILCSHSFHG